VVFSFIPACGHCRWCAEGKQNLCNIGANTLVGSRLEDRTSFRMSFEGRPVGQMSCISTFSEFTTVDVRSLVKVPEHLPLNRLALLGCGVSTGWGSAVNAADVSPGQTIIVMGIGGIGISAVQGALHAGASQVIAVDPLEFKRQCALEFGATHAAASMAEATEIAQKYTEGQGADATIVTVGVTKGEHVHEALDSIRKAGTVVVTGVGPAKVSQVPIDLLNLAMRQKRIVGSLFGMASPNKTIPHLVNLYEQRRLKLDEMVTHTYKLDEIAQGYRDLLAGTVLRAVVEF
jgi:NDMA-dependent alcohol dehydrogenase